MKFSCITTQAISLLVCCASCTSSTSEVELPSTVELPSPVEIFPDVECPLDCQDLFRKFEDELEGNMTSFVRLQVRGEPKSGTGMTTDWGWGALAHVGLYLQRLYGRESCQILSRSEKGSPQKINSIVFEPELAANDIRKPCTCTGVNKVEIELTARQKHKLPVDRKCRWSHSASITKKVIRACEPPDGGSVENHADLCACVQASMCKITDHSFQIAVLRDPRAVTVSTYFHLARKKSTRLTSEQIECVDDFFRKYLDIITQWISIRYLLFTQILAERSEVFWYEDAVADPMEWHGRYYAFVGLRPPLWVIHYAADAAAGGGDILGSRAKGLDYHPGGEDRSPTRDFRDELSAESLNMMDDVLRKWLPPILLRRLRLID